MNPPRSSSSPRPRVLIIGCGFGGLAAARALAGAPIDLTVIDRSNHHLFQPLLYQVATAGLSAPSIAAPIRHMLRRQANATVLMAEVSGIDKQARCVDLSDGQRLGYDFLIVASGATHSYFGRDDWAEHAPGLKTMADAFKLRAKVLTAFERAEALAEESERQAWLNFVVIGAGPTGVEMAGTLAEIARHTLRNEFRRIDPAKARVILLEGGERVLAAFKPELSARAAQQLQHLGVEVRCGCRVVEIDEEGVEVESASGRQRIEARTRVWAAGVAASPLGRMLAVPLDRAGRVQVDARLNIPEHPELFVIGDLAAALSHEPDGSTRPVPGVSPGAKQMGAFAAAQILAVVRAQVRAQVRAEASGSASRGQVSRGQVLPAAPKFRYRDYGNLATIGRKAAVADVGRLQFSGYLAWLFWLFVHVYFLIGFRNRLVVLMDWAWAYWSFQRYARVVAEPASSEISRKTER
ncbi:NAD(P)/FAD-dependent oxidoreductase [Paucibacter sp. Y2R2-4]|uniref:NAD(P)/FAD-dependent oxidoreductase n=1 Tax=Paucibacter sp. Y2R2-4 TaxID=2893553 RepID=UPI0021E3A045|nr:NAD(P)/FAD-dependent oxidoreductase [Paucibacter sp. Y2R2-4]MCV2350740.1 NAD(P)/FAD-dependent oxidoreductase [Paucibacter sp. Y2R2-4]